MLKKFVKLLWLIKKSACVIYEWPLRLHGPVGIMKMYEATENFVILFDFRVMYHNPENDPVYSDSAITVKHIPLKAEIDKPIISPEPKYCKWVPDMDFTNKGKAIYINLCTVVDL